MEEDKERDITVIGGQETLKSLQTMAEEVHPKMIVVGAGKIGAINAERELRAFTHAHTVIVDGTFFEPREPRVKSPQAKRLEQLAIEASMYDPYLMRNKRPRVRPDVDIVEEFKLIQFKKSTLARSDRDWVERTFHELYKIKPNGKK